MQVQERGIHFSYHCNHLRYSLNSDGRNHKHHGWVLLSYWHLTMIMLSLSLIRVNKILTYLNVMSHVKYLIYFTKYISLILCGVIFRLSKDKHRFSFHGKNTSIPAYVCLSQQRHSAVGLREKYHVVILTPRVFEYITYKKQHRRIFFVVVGILS